MVVIRLFRTGTHKRPQYRIVVIDERRPRQGRFLENLGTYDPSSKSGQGIQLDRSGIDRWVANGARMSDTVRSLVRRQQRSQVPVAEAPGGEAKLAENGSP